MMKHFDRRHFIRAAGAAALFVPAMPGIIRAQALARTMVTAPFTLYYAPPPFGSPSGNGSAASPYPSAAFIWNLLQAQYDLAGLPGTVVNIQALAGPYATGENITGPLVGQRGASSVKINGNPTAPIVYDTRLSSPIYVAFAANDGAKYTLGGFHHFSSQANIAVDQPGSHVVISDYMVYDQPQDHHISATNGGIIDITANYDIQSGTPGNHLNVFGAGSAIRFLQSSTVKLLGNSLWFNQGFANLSGPCSLQTSNTNFFAGYNGWGPRLILSGGGYCNTGSTNPATFFPGSTPVQNTGGYLV
jgi:hypothetical protein